MDDEKRRSGAGGAAEEEMSAGIRTAETMLRLAPVALCVAALVVMLKDSESSDFGSVSYSNLIAFRYLVHANGICAGYSLLSAAITAMSRSSSTFPRAWTFFCLDQVLTYMVLGAGAVSSEVIYIAYRGDSAITWSEACSSFGSFCHKATASVVITFVVVSLYVFLSLLSSYKLFSLYGPPPSSSVHSHKDTVQVAVFGA
ncbi:PREDICTED: CASP-like protein 2A1 [Tarenaya hassleriana]|uniref:CASP-like protein 2A1 n=1 Tax=Tarenaya hassleriana TaxID=28532 RepID=UPI00053C4E01|nr:PREDICTED: CASP-like protein 2A1 [Tarenaya hassleriana]